MGAHSKADEVVAQTEQQQKKPCFILTCPVLVAETVAWSDLGQGDYYPTSDFILSNFLLDCQRQLTVSFK
jgi:hypothetical protein